MSDNYRNIPEELHGGCWAVVTLDTFSSRDRKPSKKPRHPITGRDLNVKFPHGGIEQRRGREAEWSPWASFSDCAAVVAQGVGCPALGRLFQVEEGFTVLDLDATDDPGIQAQQQRLYNATASTYAELSVSGRGCHIVVRAHLNGGRRTRDQGLEVYGHARFMILTGNVLEGRTEILPMQDGIDQLVASIGGLRNLPEISVDDALLRNAHLSADELRAAVFKARNGEYTLALFEQGYSAPPPPHARDQSPSAYDAAFMERLCFFEPSWSAVLEVWERSALWRPGDKRNGNIPLYEAYLRGTYEWGLGVCRKKKAEEAAVVQATIGPFLARLEAERHLRGGS